jgi:cob(I)alamin adenosyltransferase
MVVLNKIWTTRGDDGTTGLVTGERRPKSDVRIAAYGTVDETNAAIGLARLHTAGTPLDELLGQVQNDLFDLAADLATPEQPGATPEPGRLEPRHTEPLRVVDSQVLRLEADLDALNRELPTLRSFVLPGGSAAAAHLHFARATARRAERYVVQLAQHETVSGPARRYLNRLSDFLYVAARTANDRGARDVLWRPGATR